MSSQTYQDESHQQRRRQAVPQIAPLIALTQEMMTQVNQVILEKMGSDVPLIPELAGHLIAAGGKRIRPMLVLAGYRAAREMQGAKARGSENEPETKSDNTIDDKSALYLAAAVEFIHNATLLHDDVIDQSEQRRGRDTANALWGNEASVLVGDFLFARAFELMVQTGDITVLDLLSSASARITEGEVLQMTLQGQPESPISDYLRVIEGKTAILFAAAAEAGARVGGGDMALRQAMHSYGLKLGMAFQMMDDALDYDMSLADTGKNQGDDFAEGKITLPVLLAYEQGDATERAFWSRALQTPEKGDFETALELCAKYEVVAQTRDEADKAVDEAIGALDMLADGPLRQALADAAAFSANRDH